MGRSKKDKHRRSRSSSSDGHAVNKRALLKRIKCLEEAISARSARSRSHSRPSSSRRRPRSRSSSSRRRSRSRSASRPHSRLRSEIRSYRHAQVSPTHSEQSALVRPVLTEAPLSRSPSPQLPGSGPGVGQVGNTSINEEPLVIHNDITLPDEVMGILGEDPSKDPSDRFSLHEALAARWRHFLTHDMVKEDRLTLLGKYPVPDNLPELAAPKLNPELLTLIPRPQMSREAAQAEYQQQLGRGLSALGQGMNVLFENVENLPEAVKQPLLIALTDAGRIFTHLFHRTSMTRRTLLCPLLNTKVVELLKECPPSELLFGSDLGEKIKLARGLDAVRKDLRPAPPFRGTSKVNPDNRKGERQQQLLPTSRPLNRQSPARPKRGTGPQKGRSSNRHHQSHSTSKKLSNYKRH
ncbi:unnamed protein product [Brassicogethes aeneus]|uniref:Uncharacterized protein n=1 Tax=Brassicogethes aeneus TaxID=1431903 RepID=A0A9P0B2K9_BRAAE|nr:unnamed protein product [Brassicogethes aeneus]